MNVVMHSRPVAVFYNVLGLGHINPSLPIVRALIEIGFRVVYFSYPQRKNLIESTGAEYVNYGDDSFTTAKYNPGQPFPLQLLPAAVAVLPYVLEKTRALSPDVFIFDQAAPWGWCVGQILKRPSVCLVSGRLEYKFARDEVSPDAANQHAVRVLKEKYGVEYDWRNTFLNPTPCMIVFSVPEFVPPPPAIPRPHIKYVGPIIDQTRPDQHVDDFPLTLLTDPTHGAPIVFVAFGTVASVTAEFYTKVIDALVSEDNRWTAIVAVRGPPAANHDVAQNGSPAHSGSSSDVASAHQQTRTADARAVTSEGGVGGGAVRSRGNVHVFTSYVPQLEILKHAALFVSHCGMNSVHEALFYGVPIIGVPFQADQPANADRLVALGLGLRLDPAALTAASLRTAVETVLGDANIKARTIAMCATMRSAGGLQEAVQEIKQTMGTPST